MKKYFLGLLFILSISIPVLAQHRQPVATEMNAEGKLVYVDFRVSDLTKPEAEPDPQSHVSIQKAGIFDFQCTATPTNPPTGNARFYCDSGTGQMACLTSTGASCLAGGGSGGGPVTSVGLAAPTGITVTGSPVTGTGTLTWAMPAGWILGDLLVGNGSNSVARLAGATTPDNVPQVLISTPAASAATLPAFALPGLGGRVVSGTTDTIVATDRAPATVEYTSNSATAVTVPDPASAGFTANPAFVTIAEGLGPYTFTPQTSAVITYCDGSNCFAGQPSLTLQKGQYATWSSPGTSNWFVRVASTQPIAQPPVVNGLISGGGVTWTGLLTFTCSAATYAIGGTVYNSPQTNLTLSAADPTNPRIDVIAVNSSGACVAITGTPAGSPAAPSVNPTSQLSLTFVTIAANATTPTLSSILVYDENSTPPTEYTCTPTSNFNCNSTNNPYHLTHDIEATTAVATNSVTLVNSGTVNFSTYSTLSFNIRNKANWPNAKSLQICFLNSATVVGNCVAFKNGVFGFNQTNIASYQQIVIPLSQFALGSTVADRVRFQVIGGGGSIGFYLDWIQIQSTLSGSGASNFQLQVNGQNTLQTANLTDNASVTFSHTPGLNGVDAITATAVGAPPSGAAGGDLSGTFPNPTVAKVNNASVPASANVLGSNGSSQLVAATQTAISAPGYVAGGGSANAQTATLSPAIAAYTNGLRVCWLPTAANSTTTPTLAVNGLTATTIVKTGGAALAANDLTTTAVACAVKGTTNFELQNPQTTTAGGITSINTSATGPAVTIVGSGGATVSTSGNTVTVAGSLGPPSPTWVSLGGNYTVLDSDNGSRLRFNTAGTATLGTPNTISASPLVALRYQAANISSTPSTSSAFSQSASHQLFVTVTNDSGTAQVVSSVSSAADGALTKLTETVSSPSSVSIWWIASTAASGSNTITVTWAGTPGRAQVTVEELQGAVFDVASSTTATGITGPIHFSSALAICVNGQNSPATIAGWNQYFSQNGATGWTRLLSNQSQAVCTPNNGSIAVGIASFSISAVPTFTAGWNFIAEALAAGGEVITPTASTINGQTSLLMPPNETCNIMSNGANYDAICGFAPNITTNGVMGGTIEVAGRNTVNTSADIGTTTLLATWGADSFFQVSADVTCRSAIAGTETLTITYTDTSNTAQTITGSAVCTSLGGSSILSIVQAFRVKASTNIQIATSHTGSQPTYDVSVALYQHSTL